MKNKLNFYVIAVMLVIVAVSCKKKSGEEDITSLPYANESASQSKSNLETTGQSMVTELSNLADVQGVGTAQSLSYFLDMSAPFTISTQSAVIFSSVKTAATNGANKDVKGVYRFLTTTVGTTPDTTIIQVYNKNKGIYTWNASLKKWDKTASNDKIELVFPSTKTGTTNDAKFDFTYQSKMVSSSSASLNGELPLSIDAVLSVGSDKIMEYSFTAQYNSDNTPSSVSTFLALYPFKFETTVTNNSSTASVRYLFTDDTKTIFDFYVDVNGSLSQNSVANSTNAEDVINNANAYFQVFNIKLAGRIDVKGLSSRMNEIYSNTEVADSTINKQEVAAMNQYIALVLMYADTKQKIAQAEFYPIVETETYSYGNEVYTYYYYDSDIRFIFTDGSKGSLESYFGNGFKDVITDFNTLLVKLNNNFGLGAGQVTYTGN